MNKEPSKSQKKDSYQPSFFRNVFIWLLFLFILIQLFNLGTGRYTRLVKEFAYGEFYQLLKENKIKIKEAKLIEDLLQGRLEDGSYFQVRIYPDDKDLLNFLKEHVKKFVIVSSNNFLTNFLYYLAPTILFILFLWFFAYRGAKLGDRIWSFSKAKVKLVDQNKHPKVTFNDVAGVDEAKEELKEVIEFLKDPKKFQRLGGKIPKGVLLVGPPGVGKTLLAKAVAGEAGVPFFSISGSDFVELFVGVGASRVRDLFEQAKKAAKISGKGAIIFIDEIDAVGRLRFAGIGGGHDEREQTLNQLLVEMDGFDPNEGIIVMAATNRPDVLDPALLRPGRFDRHIVIDRPDIKGREEILKVHTKNIKLAKDVDLRKVARQTPGFSGADLANLCNEAALLAARKNKEAVTMAEFEEAIERLVAGPQRKSRVISKKEKEIVAFHESGHALLALLLPEVDPLHKVSIIPRGVASLGYTMQLPIQDRYILTKKELLSRMTVLLGGRAAEELIFNEITTGAQNDLEVVTEMARRMVCEFGMSTELGNLAWGRKEGPVFLGRDLIEKKDYSEQTSQLIDKEIKKIVDECYERAKSLLRENLEKLKLLAKTLLEKEILDGEEVKEILGFKDSNENLQDNKSS